MYQKHRWLWLLTAVFYLIVAGVIMYNPGVSLASLTILFTVFMLMSGIAQIMIYASQPSGYRSGGILAWGIITVLMSIWILSSNYTTLALIIPYAFAFWVLMGSVTKIMLGIESRKTGLTNGGLFIFLGILGIILGILLLYHPLISGLFINYLIVALFIYESFSAVVHFANAKPKED